MRRATRGLRGYCRALLMSGFYFRRESSSARVAPRRATKGLRGYCRALLMGGFQNKRRMKTYTAETGYVYQYYFVGKREALPQAPEAPAAEYVFDVTPDRKT